MGVWLLELAALIDSPSLGLDAADAVFADDQQVIVVRCRQHAGDHAGLVEGAGGQWFGSTGTLEQHAIGTDANASLTSNRSTSAVVQPIFL